jgi:hypothetical protein
MRVERLRPLPSPEQMAALYPEPHDHRIYGRGHHERVERTITLTELWVAPAERRIVADLSCGNGSIARRLCTNPPNGLHLGDYAGEVARDGEAGYLGAIEQTVHDIPLVDVFVCSETVEHLDDPLQVLRAIRSRAEFLVLSTPIECWDDGNPEHLWAWDREGVEDLCARAGWRPLRDGALVSFANVDSREWGEPYNYGIWVMG